jgi:hypothetical protein
MVKPMKIAIFKVPGSMVKAIRNSRAVTPNNIQNTLMRVFTCGAPCEAVFAIVTIFFSD